MAGDAVPGEDRIATVPNLITLVRFFCIPVFVLLLLRAHHAGWYPAALLLAALGVTDGIDGYVARRFHQVSTLGKVLDPLADRLLLGVAAVSIIAVGAVPLWVAIVALLREAVVAGGFLYVAAAGGRRMEVQWAGKAGTFGLMCALPLFLAGHANDDWHAVAEIRAWLCVAPALLFGYYAVVTYVPRAREALAESHRQRSAETLQSAGEHAS
jgi:cardiolipin synthase